MRSRRGDGPTQRLEKRRHTDPLATRLRIACALTSVVVVCAAKAAVSPRMRCVCTPSRQTAQLMAAIECFCQLLQYTVGGSWCAARPGWKLKVLAATARGHCDTAASQCSLVQAEAQTLTLPVSSLLLLPLTETHAGRRMTTLCSGDGGAAASHCNQL